MWSFLIPAAGQGLRLGLGPKATVEIAGRSLVEWCLEKAAAISDDVLLAVPEEYVDDFRRTYSECTVIAGGATRQDSIRGLLELAARDWVMVHDVVRPFASATLMQAVAAAAGETGAAGTFGRVDVPVAVISGGLVVDHYSASQVGLCHSPLAFRKDVLIASYVKAAAEQREQQSTIALVMAAGFRICVVEGERGNIKITDLNDLHLARFLASRDIDKPA